MKINKDSNPKTISMNASVRQPAHYNLSSSPSATFFRSYKLNALNRKVIMEIVETKYFMS